MGCVRLGVAESTLWTCSREEVTAGAEAGARLGRMRGFEGAHCVGRGSQGRRWVGAGGEGGGPALFGKTQGRAIGMATDYSKMGRLFRKNKPAVSVEPFKRLRSVSPKSGHFR